MDSGFLNVNAIAKGSNGTIVNAELYFPTDPGYRDTVTLPPPSLSYLLIAPLGTNACGGWTVFGIAREGHYFDHMRWSLYSCDWHRICLDSKTDQHRMQLSSQHRE
jgi:hypothetical protein